DFHRLAPKELVALFVEWSRGFVSETYVQAEKINIAADFYLKVAKAEIEKRGLDPATFLSGLSGTVVHQAMSLLPAIASGDKDVSDFIDLFGHRAPIDYELAQPRYSEATDVVYEMASRARPSPSPRIELPAPETSNDRMFLLITERARRYQ